MYTEKAYKHTYKYYMENVHVSIKFPKKTVTLDPGVISGKHNVMENGTFGNYGHTVITEFCAY
jgi:hypothetical protein